MKNVLKLALKALLVLFFLTGVSGCSGEADTDTPRNDKPGEEVTYTITYQTAYGTAPAVKTVAANTVITDDYLPVLPAATADGVMKIFTGWKLNGADITASSKKAVTANITLVAAWRDKSADDVKYTVKHMQENADDNEYTLAVSEELYGTKGSQTSATAKIYEGFDAVATVSQKAIAEDGTTVIEIKYQRTKVTLTFDLDGGSGLETTLTAKYGATLTVASPAKDGYSFAGWTPALPAKVPLSATTYKAGWTAVQKDVSVTKIEVTGAASVAKGASVTLTANVSPANATKKTVTWTANVTEGVTVSNGKITVADSCTASQVTVTATATDGSGVSGSLTLTIVDVNSVSAGISITEEKGWLETAYIKWSAATSDTIDGYNVYVKESGGNYVKLDDMLVRAYSNTAGGTTIDYYRADALGLKAGTYQMKVVGTVSGQEAPAVYAESGAITVEAHDRSGFAFNGTTTPGAYKADGTLKDNAVVIYITKDNVDTVTCKIQTDTSKTEECTGITGILLGLKKNADKRPFAIRIVGAVNNDGKMTSDTSNFAGDMAIKGASKDLAKRLSCGITIEGVGDDATSLGWGVRIANSSYVEVRNIGFILCDSGEGDNVGLQQDNDHIWVHNCDMFYGAPGKDKDQVKGDGALDSKLSNYVTFSYNHFYDNGKCNLLGLKENVKSTDSNPYYITYHHNWYDHSDSRHPRCRYYNAHVYNNYYDGNAKYGAGSTLGSSVFMEANYFRSCKFPMMISMQGSDVYAGGTTRDTANNPTFSKEDGGIIKAYNNKITGKCTFIAYGATTYTLKGVEGSSLGGINSTADFDAYVVTSRSQTVPDTVKSYQGTNVYSNFDTASGFYSYAVDEPDTAVTNVKKYAGRMYGGELKWTFTEADDESYEINSGLKAMLSAYKTKLVKVLAAQASGSGTDGSGEGSGETPASGGDTPSTDPTPSTPSSSGAAVISFSGSTTSSDDRVVCSTVKSYNTEQEYNGVKYGKGAKLNTSGTVTVTLEKEYKVTFVLGTDKSGYTKGLTIDDTAVAITSANLVTVTLATGTHTVKNGGSESSVFLVILE